MAKITDMTALAVEPASGDVFPIVDISEPAAADRNKKIAYSTIKTALYNPLDSRITTAEGDITVIEGDITTIEEDISDLDSRITFLEDYDSYDKYVTNPNGNPNVSDTAFAVISSVADSSWETVGPTDSGMSNTWTALDNLPDDISWIEVRAVGAFDAVSNAVAGYNVYVTDPNSGEPIGRDNNVIKYIVRATTSETYGLSTTFKIPVADKCFYIYRAVTNVTGHDLDLFVVGYGFNG